MLLFQGCARAAHQYKQYAKMPAVFFFYLPSTASTYALNPILKGLSGTGEQLSCNHKFRDNFWPCIAGCLLYNHIFSCDFGGLFGVILCLVKVMIMNLSIGCDVQTKARASHRLISKITFKKIKLSE
jgi:hypothetical protein